MAKSFIRLCFLAYAVIFFNACSKNDSSSGSSLNHSANLKATGASANDMLSAGTYSTAVIEIQYMPGYQPDATAVNNLVAFLNLLANKPGGISVTQTMIPAGGKFTYTLDDIANIEKANRTAYNSGGTLALNFLYVDGLYTENNVLGIAYRNTSMCLFGKALVNNSGGINQPSRTKLESTILEHEMGHILGLVNLGSPMQVAHEDATHEKHCNSNTCLMYWSTQTTGIMGPLMSGNVPALDANCRADLKANGGK